MRQPLRVRRQRTDEIALLRRHVVGGLTHRFDHRHAAQAGQTSNGAPGGHAKATQRRRSMRPWPASSVTWPQSANSAFVRQYAEFGADWVEKLQCLFAYIGYRFGRVEMQQRAWEYLVGLLSPLERNNGWQLAEAAAHTTPYSMQHLLDRAPWDAEAVRDDLVDYVAVELGDPDGVLVVRTLNKRTHPKGDGDSRLGGMTSIVFDLDEAGVMLSSPEPAAAPVAPRRRPLCIGSQNSYLRLRTKMGSQPGNRPPTVLRFS
jgi:hypothetical protein